MMSEPHDWIAMKQNSSTEWEWKNWMTAQAWQGETYEEKIKEKQINTKPVKIWSDQMNLTKKMKRRTRNRTLLLLKAAIEENTHAHKYIRKWVGKHSPRVQLSWIVAVKISISLLIMILNGSSDPSSYCALWTSKSEETERRGGGDDIAAWRRTSNLVIERAHERERKSLEYTHIHKESQAHFLKHKSAKG